MSAFLILVYIFIKYKACSGVFLIGTRIQEGQFPWLVQFKTITPCGGVLISADWVLTAAQCVQINRQSLMLQAVGLNGTGSPQVIRVLHAYFHPEYKIQFHENVYDHDHNIALIKLVEPFNLCDSKIHFLNIGPINYGEKYKSCLIFGWQGYVGPSMNVFAKPIQYTHVTLNEWEYCIYLYKANISYSNAFCTMVEANDDVKACAGNPGTPVVCEDQYDRMILLGIASWTKFSFYCDELPSYLSINIFRSWINELVSSFQKLENQENSSIKNSNCKNKPEIKETEEHSSQEISEQSTSVILTKQMNKSPVFYDINNYKMIPNDECMFTGNISEQTENLYRHQEIGQYRADGSKIERSAEYSKQEAPKPYSKKAETGDLTEYENVDDFDEILPFDFEDYPSKATYTFVLPSCFKYKFIFYFSSLHTLYRCIFL